MHPTFGHAVWDPADWAFVTGDAPDSVHPSLWRQAQLNAIHGLFEVADGVYQVRGVDLSNITFIAGDTGWIVIDPLTASETAAFALDLLHAHFPARPGGRGDLHPQPRRPLRRRARRDHRRGRRERRRRDHRPGRVPRGRDRRERGGRPRDAAPRVVHVRPAASRRRARSRRLRARARRSRSSAPRASSRRRWRSPTPARSGSSTACGCGSSTRPTPRRPAEMNIDLPDRRLLCMAENCSSTLHNVYTPRGAQIRDALAWSKYINESIELFGATTDIVFMSHHWPRFGNDGRQSGSWRSSATPTAGSTTRRCGAPTTARPRSRSPRRSGRHPASRPGPTSAGTTAR